MGHGHQQEAVRADDGREVDRRPPLLRLPKVPDAHVLRGPLSAALLFPCRIDIAILFLYHVSEVDLPYAAGEG